jgi:propionyl-CoA carboxylase alpha chain
MAERFRWMDTVWDAAVKKGPDGQTTVLLDGASYVVGKVQYDSGRLTFNLDGVRVAFETLATPSEVWIPGPLGTRRFERVGEEPEVDPDAVGALRSKMPGVVLQVLVEPGTAVQAGAPLLILEAMKMEHQLVAPSEGVVRSLPVSAGQRVMPGDLLVDFEPAADV